MSEEVQTNKEMLQHLVAKIDRIDAAIRGNGSPGLRQRVDSLEQKVYTSRAWWSDLSKITIAGAVGGALAMLASPVAAAIHSAINSIR